MKLAKFEDEFFKGFIKQKEGENLDFKLKITSKEKIAKTLSAFANTKGGFIVIGITDNKRIVGIDPEEERFMVESANEEYCIPKVSLTILDIKVPEEKLLDSLDEEEKFLLLVEINKSLGPKIFIKSKTGELKSYIRVNDQTLAV